MSESFDVRIITASYRREPAEGPEDRQEPVIQLFGRTRDGRSIAIEYSGFKPYFYVVTPPQALRGAFARDKQVVAFEDVTLEVEGRPTPCAKVVLRQPWKTPEYREKARKFGSTPLEADIPFQHRFIYDMDLGAAVRVHGTLAEAAGHYTTELFLAAERFEPCEPFRPALRVLSFDIENSIRDGHIFCIGVAHREAGEIQTRILTGNEKEIIERFVKLIDELDPDIISGYNIDGYDLPVLIERAAKHGMPRLGLARDHSTFFHLGERFWRLDGRILTDVWWAVKAEMRPKQETLDYVAKHLLGEGKHELQRRKIDEEWERDRDKVIRYCINDAELSLRILERVRRIEKTLDLAAVSKLPLEDVLHGRTSNLIDSILIRAADRAKVAVPMMKMRGGRVEQIEGGYVHSLQPGLYEWVISLDFRAMYPSLIIENNICFTTVSSAGTIASPTGAKFLAADEKKGLLPVILANLMKDREEVRSRMRETKDPQMKEFYEGLQAAIKVLMNAFYGVLASSFYRFNDPKVGASITAFARERIKGIIGELEADGVKVVYADTDSVFFQSPVPGLESSRDFARTTAERFSRGRISMEVDKIYETLFSHGRKKRYAGKVAWPEELQGQMIVRGYEIRRTDAFDLQSESQRRVFEKILDRDQEGAVTLARQIVAEVREGMPPLEDSERDPIEALVISRTVKEETRYVNPNSMSNVIAARKLEEMGEEFMPGMKVSWIVTDARRSPMEVEPYVSGRPFDKKPDWEYYARRVAQTLAYITEAYGWDEKALFTGTQPAQQKSLFSEDFDEREPAEEDDRKADRKLTLEDFF
ncbi:MAG TPA: DNA polymerase domain-containing protein [Thermoplasmata archaeon]|nr:DNA polymerase domain-containing protein [Thermoplasmata archaeon]